MDGNMLDVGKMCFHAVVNTFRNGVRFPERQIAINLKLQLDIYFISKHSGMEQIHLYHIFLCGNISCQVFS